MNISESKKRRLRTQRSIARALLADKNLTEQAVAVTEQSVPVPKHEAYYDPRYSQIIPHNYGYCYLCDTTIKLTLIREHHLACAREHESTQLKEVSKQLSVSRRPSSSGESATKKQKVTTTSTNAQRMEKCKCSIPSCGKKSNAKSVVIVKVGDYEQNFCTIEHLTKDCDASVINSLKRRMKSVEQVAVALKKVTCSHCENKCTGTIGLFALHARMRPISVACSTSCFVELLKMIIAHYVLRHVKKYDNLNDETQEEDEEHLLDSDDDDTQNQEADE